LHLSSALALTGHQAEAHEVLERYLALGGVHAKTIAQLRAQVIADTPAWAEFTERLFAGLRKAGMPEEWTRRLTAIFGVGLAPRARILHVAV
jgi:hypothetical protein